MPQTQFFLWTFKLVVQQFHLTLYAWYALLLQRFWAKKICFTSFDKTLTRGYELSFTMGVALEAEKFYDVN